jgi:hypothetical protein
MLRWKSMLRYTYLHSIVFSIAFSLLHCLKADFQSSHEAPRSSLEWGGRISNYPPPPPPPHFLTCLMKFCFLVIQKPNAWYAIHQKLWLKGRHLIRSTTYEDIDSCLAVYESGSGLGLGLVLAFINNETWIYNLRLSIAAGSKYWHSICYVKL